MSEPTTGVVSAQYVHSPKLLLFYFVLLFLLLAPAFAGAQAISINTDASDPDPSAILDVKSTDKGVLVPRMSTAQRTAITAAEALMVFDSDTKSFWFFDSAAAAWREIRAGNIATLADADGDTKVQVEKLSDEDIIRFDLGGTESLVLRKNASGDTSTVTRSLVSGREPGAAQKRLR